jgi:hypothetical protein
MDRKPDYQPEVGDIIDGYYQPTPFIVLQTEDEKVFGIYEFWPGQSHLTEWGLDEYRKVGAINPATLRKLKTQFNLP